jgi:uncharacterized phage-associated protein
VGFVPRLGYLWHKHINSVLSAFVGEYGVREVIMFLLKSLGGRVYSVKKLMKLVFLAQYDVDVERRIVYEYRYGGRPLARADFYIWSYGPMSNEVYDALESEDFDLVQGELGLEIYYAGPAPQLPRPVAARLSDVAAAWTSPRRSRTIWG